MFQQNIRIVSAGQNEVIKNDPGLVKIFNQGQTLSNQASLIQKSADRSRVNSVNI
jgi:hypothetical protein